MGQSTEELSTQIAGTRESLANDLDALQDKVSPAAIVDRQKQAAKGRVRSVRDKVMGSAQSAKQSVGSGTDSATGAVSGAVSSANDTIEGSPIAAGLVAFGAGLVIAGLFPASQAEKQASQKVVDAAQPLLEEARTVGQDMGSQLKDSAVDSAQQLKDSAAQSAQTVKDEGASSAETVRAEAPGSV